MAMTPSAESPGPEMYGICFYQGGPGSGKRYHFVRKLYRGGQAATQLVWDVEGKELLVRKAGRRHPELNLMTEETEFIQGLHAKERMDWAEAEGLVPRIPRVYAVGDRPGNFDEEDKHEGVSYYSLCNGGDLYFFQKKYPNWRTKETESRAFPLLLLARFIHQMCQTLQFLAKSIPEEPIYHQDLAAANVFVHWPNKDKLTLPDFYLGDFGLAKVIPPNSPFARVRFTKWDIDALLSIVIELLDYDDDEWNELIASPDQLGQVGDVLRELTRLNNLYDEQRSTIETGGLIKIPDLKSVIEMARNAEAACAAEEKLWYFRYEHKHRIRWGGVKLHKSTFKTESEAIASGKHLRVSGPWYISKIDRDSQTVIEYGDEDKSGTRFEIDNEFDSDESERERALAALEQESDSSGEEDEEQQDYRGADELFDDVEEEAGGEGDEEMGDEETGDEEMDDDETGEEEMGEEEMDEEAMDEDGDDGGDDGDEDEPKDDEGKK